MRNELPPEVLNARHPDDLWTALVGSRPSPGAWPPADGENERPITGWLVAAFEAEDIEELLERWGA